MSFGRLDRVRDDISPSMRRYFPTCARVNESFVQAVRERRSFMFRDTTVGVVVLSFIPKLREGWTTWPAIGLGDGSFYFLS